MNNGPIDFDSPLGISKKEWTKVLGVNLALLLLVYAITVSNVALSFERIF